MSNIWCALNTRPVSIRERIDPNIQPLISLMLTSVMISPSCYSMYRLGMQEANGHDRDTIQKHWVLLLWGTASCSLSFFLASFQVHEKSILLVLAPCALLLGQDEAFVEWFSILCTRRTKHLCVLRSYLKTQRRSQSKSYAATTIKQNVTNTTRRFPDMPNFESQSPV